MFEIIIFFVFVSIALHYRWKNRYIISMYNRIGSGFIALPFIGHSYLFFGGGENRMKAFQITGRDAIRRRGVTSFWHGSKLFAMVADPALAEVVLKTCLEKDDIMKVARLLTGNGSIFAEVPIWRPRRKIITSQFSVKNLSNFVPSFAKQSKILVKQLRSTLGNDDFSIWKYITTYTMDTVCETTLGVEVNAQRNPDHPFLKAFELNLQLAADRFLQPWLHNSMIYKMFPAYTQFMETKSVICDFISKIITSKRDEIQKVNDKTHYVENVNNYNVNSLLALLMNNRGEMRLTDLELQEEMLVMVLAGTDTSAVAVAFTLVMLSMHQDIQQKVYEELQEVFGDSDRTLEAQDLLKLKYLDAVFRETLRLYPPVPIIARKVEKEVVLPSGVTLVPGSGVFINIWATHRNPQYWGDDAEEFRPERFLDSPIKHPAALIPFSHGPRACLGYQFAMMSSKTAIATLLRQYRVLPPANQLEPAPLRLTFDVMMKDVDNFRVQLLSRT